MWRTAPHVAIAIAMALSLTPGAWAEAVRETGPVGTAPQQAGLPQFAKPLLAVEPKAKAGAPAVAQKPKAAPQTAQDKSDVALGGDMSRTRFLIGLDQSVEFQVFSLSNPNRVIVELPTVAMKLPPPPRENEPVGLVRAFSAGEAGPGKTRVVISVTRAVVVESAKVEKARDGKGKLLALEIVQVEAGDKQAKKQPLKSQPFALGATDVQPPLPARAVRPDVRAAKAFKPIIVIDPGHGGHDSGAMKNGVVEKDVVLAFSKLLKKKLEESGRYKVLMTRDTDEFIELGERTAYAERNKANLFIAVHADYADDNSRARGATIYSLRDSVANALKRSAKGDVSENVLSSEEAEIVRKASAGGDPKSVRNILADLAGREVEVTKERTNIFSRSVIEFMGESTSMRTKPDQQAAFRVLKTAQFPSVLIELAYVTNKEDAELLKSDVWRDKVSGSIMTAVDNYFSNQIAQLPL